MEFLHADRTGQFHQEDREHCLAPVFTTADGKSVVNRLDTQLSGAALSRLRTAIARINTEGRSYISQEVEFPEVLGHSIVVETTLLDKIVYAQRSRRHGLSRMVIGKQPEPTRHLTVTLLEQQKAKGTYLLISAWYGRKAEIEPYDFAELNRRPTTPFYRKRVRNRAREFWKNHAFVLEYTTLHWPYTITDQCPRNWGEAPLIGRRPRKRKGHSVAQALGRKPTKPISASQAWSRRDHESEQRPEQPCRLAHGDQGKHPAC